MPLLHERDLVALLLVKAVEEGEPVQFSREALSESALAALDARDDAALLSKRSAVLFLRLPRALRAWAHVGLLPEHSIGAVAAAAFLVGALSNSLGPAQRVHVVYNPLAFLIVWNLGLFAALAWRWRSRRAGRRTRTQAAGEGSGVDAGARPVARPEAADRDAREVRARSRLLEYVLPGVWLALQSARVRFRSGRAGLAQLRGVGERFWPAYWNAAGPVVAARVRALVHFAAIALLGGALAGIYVRGLFFEYSAIWHSTFLNAGSIAFVLNALLAPACWLLDGGLLGQGDVLSLLAPEGSPAAPWIHRLALTAALAVALPRAALALAAAQRARSCARSLALDFTEPYYAETLRSVREGLIHRVREGVSGAVRLEIAKYSESVALFVRSRFFDQIAAPALLGFRNRGGRVAELEAELAAQRERFASELDAHLRASDAEFQQHVAAAVREIAGAELGRAPAPIAGIAPGSLPVDPQLGDGVAAGVGDAVGISVTAAATAAVATLSGGLGKTLGVALVSTLLHTTGPIGLLIGGIAALATFGAAFALGRDRVAAAAKTWHIPAPIAALALRDAKLEQARAATYRHVKQAIEDQLEPQAAATSEAVLRQLALAVGGADPDAPARGRRVAPG